MLKTKYLPLFFLFVVFAVPDGFSQSTVKIYGTVVDQQTGYPLHQANVWIEGTSFGTTTDMQGFYRIENLLEGTYTIIASYMGYANRKLSNIRVPKDQPVRLNFKLTPMVIPMRQVEISAPPTTENPEMDVYVIRQTDIARANYQTVGEVLAYVPGVEIQNSGGLGGRKKISIRGSQTNQVLVLLDGIPLNDELGGDVDLAKIPVNIIEKIEVHKGGSSPEFGSGAIGGVVNIVSKKVFRNRLQLSSGMGSFRFRNIEPGWSGNYRNFGYFIAYHYVENKGDYPYQYQDSQGNTIHENRMNADIRSRNLFLRLNYTWRDHSIAIQAQRMASDRGIPGKIDAWTAYARTKSEQDIIGAEYQKQFGFFNFDLNCRYATALTENANLYPPDAEKRFRRYYPWHYQYQTTNFIVQATLDYSPRFWFHLKGGYRGRLLQYKDENLMPSLTPPINQAKDLAQGLFVHQELKKNLPWWQSQFILTPMLRYDEMTIENEAHRRLEQQWSPGIRFFLSAGTTNKIYLKSHLTQSFRVPTFADLFYQDVRIEGKPDLAPEKSKNVELSLGTHWHVWGQATGEITYFQNTIDDLIVWRMGSYEVFRPFNTNAQITGQEYALEFSGPRDIMSLGIGYSYLEPLNKSNNTTTRDKFLPYRPRKSLKANLMLNYGPWRGALRYRKVGIRYVNEANTKAMPPYQILDIDFSRQTEIRSVEFTWKLSVFNFLNETYEILRDMPLPQREWRLGVTIKL